MSHSDFFCIFGQNLFFLSDNRGVGVKFLDFGNDMWMIPKVGMKSHSPKIVLDMRVQL